MDDLSLYGKSEGEIKELVSTVEAFSQNIGMEFSIKKPGVIIMNTERLSNRQDRINKW